MIQPSSNAISVMNAEGAAARGLGKLQIVAIEVGERVCGKPFPAQLILDRLYEVVAQRAEIRRMSRAPWNFVAAVPA